MWHCVCGWFVATCWESRRGGVFFEELFREYQLLGKMFCFRFLHHAVVKALDVSEENISSSG